MSRTTKSKDTQLKEKVYKNMALLLGSVSNKVKEYRLKKGISIRELSRIAEVSATAICDIENNKSLPKMEVLVKIAIALDIPISNLFNTGNVNIAYNMFQKVNFSKFLSEEGLSKTDISEVLAFINFKRIMKDKNLVKQFSLKSINENTDISNRTAIDSITEEVNKNNPYS